MQTSSPGFSIIFGLVIVVLASTMSLYLLSFIIPFSQSIKWFENSSKAFYLWSSGIEQSLWDINQNTLWYENSKTFTSDSDYRYDIVANGTNIPAIDTGNSELDNDWNIIGYGDPLQLSVGDSMVSSWGIVDIDFRVPDFDGDGNNNDQTILWNGNTIVLSWQLSSTTETLLPSGTGAFITADDINNSASFSLGSRLGIDLHDNSSSFSTFYTSNCWIGDPCILKISPILNMFLNDGNSTPIPFLEYQIDTNWQSIPTRFTNIDVSGKSYGFQKNRNIKVPQLTTDQAFDFTVFQ